MRESPGTELTRPRRLLVVAAHPGDAERAMGGSVARWVREGTVAQLVCGTSGDASGEDPDADPLAVAAAREAAQRAAAEIIGYEAVTFLHRPDGALLNDLATREQLVRLIRRFRPDTVATADPRVLIGGDGRIAHIDRRELGAAALDALDAAGRPMVFPAQIRGEGLEPCEVGRALLFWSDQATAAVSIDGSLETKLAAVAAQSGGSEHEAVRGVREQARRDGALAGLDAAETFVVVEPTGTA